MTMPWESSNLLVTSFFGLLALSILVLSSNEAVKRMIRLAEYFNLSTTFMGMTVASIATSIPEISSHVIASVNILLGKMDPKVAAGLVLGANIGSDVVQQTFILGLVVFLSGGLYFRRYFLWKSMIPMIGTTVMCIILGLDRTYSRLDGFILFGTFVAYTYYLYWDERKYFRKQPAEGGEESVPITPREALKDALMSLVMMSLTVISAQIVLGIGERVVAVTGLGGSLIGVLTLGVASALPEFTTAMAGVRHKDVGIPLGTLVGSNITNPLVAIGGGALISTYWVPGPLLSWDLPWETLTGAALWIILWFTKGRMGKGGALALMIMYFAFITLRALLFAVD